MPAGEAASLALDLGATASTSAALSQLPQDRQEDEGTQPESGLHFVLYNEQMDVVEANTGILPVDDRVNRIQDLSSDKIVIQESGYLEVYVNNEAQIPVYYDNLVVMQSTGNVIEVNAYYPYGKIIQGLSTSSTYGKNNYKYNGKELQTELELGWLDYGARMLDGPRWFVPDPLAENHYNMSPYVYCLNNPLIYIDPLGLDTVYVFDQAARPLDNGTAGQTYTADIYVEQNGVISPVYRGSSYPNSNSNTDNTTSHNTVNEGTHSYNNQSGHRQGTRQGLNLINSDGDRESPGTSSTGEAVTMTVVNVHSGASDNGNATSRGSEGCITIRPTDAANFMGHFDWSGTSGNTGASTGSIIILRGANATGTRNMVQGKRDWQQNRLTPVTPRPLSPLRSR